LINQVSQYSYWSNIYDYDDVKEEIPKFSYTFKLFLANLIRDSLKQIENIQKSQMNQKLLKIKEYDEIKMENVDKKVKEFLLNDDFEIAKEMPILKTINYLFENDVFEGK
jgi:hypothetical protein